MVTCVVFSEMLLDKEEVVYHACQHDEFLIVANP